MGFSWDIFCIVVVVNMAWIGAMYAAQQLDRSLPLRHSLIPGTNQKFLYMQDFWTMTYGDILGVPLINNAFVQIVAGTHLYTSACFGYWLLAAAFAALALVIMCLGPNHKPDMGFPDIARISWIGIIHLPYFGFSTVAAIVCAWFIYTRELRGLALYLGLGGAVIYALSFAADVKSSNFARLKKEPKNCGY